MLKLPFIFKGGRRNTPMWRGGIFHPNLLPASIASHHEVPGLGGGIIYTPKAPPKTFPGAHLIGSLLSSINTSQGLALGPSLCFSYLQQMLPTTGSGRPMLPLTPPFSSFGQTHRKSLNEISFHLNKMLQNAKNIKLFRMQLNASGRLREAHGACRPRMVAAALIAEVGRANERLWLPGIRMW